ncbi:DUF2309 domain-containing protein [Novosphingobium huizhouense]|uniref:DUF2309 domain-containing protein n=1 Tax=Novosphingobium huizhouense TaxID=2866625 RepID=UPI001CD8EE18|nr:DUF2309 domain-containing protein [Novosphingobium huizhouense]
MASSAFTPIFDAGAQADLAARVADAAQAIAPLWPLESAIAVNPLSGFEDRPFEVALREGADLFGARTTLALGQWRALHAEGRIADVALRKAIVATLGGLDAAFTLFGPDLNAFALLHARLVELPVAPAAEPQRRVLSPGMTVLARWIGCFLDRAAPPLFGRELGLYPCLRLALQADPALRAIATRDGLRLLDLAPEDPLATLGLVFDRRGIAPAATEDTVRRLFARLPGWAAHLRWRTGHAEAHQVAGAPASMLDLAALVALVSFVAGEDFADRQPAHAQPAGLPGRDEVARALLAHWNLAADAPEAWSDEARQRFARIVAMDEAALGLVFQQAAERGVIDSLGHALEGRSAACANAAPAASPAAPPAAPPVERPAAQLVFCIDVRSEPMRRAIEAAGAAAGTFETYGYAGFFGLPIALQPVLGRTPRKQLPVLLAPAHHVAEAPLPGRTDEAREVVTRRACAHRAQGMLESTKGGATGFAAAEALGPLAAVALLARTLAPRLAERLTRGLLGSAHEVFAPHASNDDEAAIPLADRIGYARGMFRLTGLPAATARLVVLVGHGGSTTNNAFAASLDCGACGGHPGGPNARLMAAILNDPLVREGLAADGLALPDDTVFLAAQHDTTRDEITLFDRASVPASHHADLAALEAVLRAAGRSALEGRAGKLARPADDLLAGAAHWGEVRPEWGLSGNAAFIVGPRRLTAGLDLEGAAFLHSYDWQTDKDGSALTTILTAPMIVAQWISCQYLFSTIDNAVYGAGDKVTQNVIGGFGVVQGNGGDLCTGLPRQSLFRDDGTPYHVPRRLTVFVQAPLRRVEEIVFAHENLVHLVENGWINLVVIDPWKHRAHHWQREHWVPRPG